MSLVAIFQRRSAHTQSPRIKIRRRLLGRCAPIAALGVAAGLLSFGMVFAPTAHASTYTWDGTVNDWFASPLHWGPITPGSYPGTGDDAVNNFTAAMTLGQSTTIQSFFSNGGFSLNAGTFSGSLANAAGKVQVNALFTLNGGQINNFTVQQGTGGSLVVTGSGSNQINSSIVNSSIDMSTNANAFLDLNGTVTENGAITLGTTNGIRLLGSGTNLIIGSAGSLTGFGNVYQYQNNTLTNNGTINANASGKTLGLGLTTFTNTGTAKATSGGILALTSTNVTNNGTLAAFGLGSVVTLTGTITNGAGSLFTTTGGGQIQVNGATLNGIINTDAATALIFNGGSNTINGATINGNLDFATNLNANADLNGTVTENGAITLGTTSNGIRLLNSGTNLIIGSAGSLTGFGSVYQYQNNTLTNNGTINANASGKSLNLALDTFNNNGTTKATNGATLNLANTHTNNNAGSTLAAKSGGIVNIAGTFTADAASTLDGAGGTFNINGATLLGTLNGTAGTSLIFNSGSNTINSVTFNSNLDFVTNANAYADLNGTVTENGNINLGTNSFRLLNVGTSLNISSTGSLTGFGQVYQYQNNTLNNSGTINTNVNAKTLNLAVDTFNNNGTTKATNGATLNLNNTSTNNNAGSTLAAIGVGSTVNIAGTFTGVGSNLISATGGGKVHVNGATLLGTINTSGAALIFNGGSNAINSATINGDLDFATTTSAYADLNGTVTENGNINLGTNSFRLLNSGTSLNIGSAGSLTGFGQVYQYQNNTLNNGGLIDANSATNSLSLAVDTFNNNSTTKATNGATLNLNNTNTNNNAGSTLAAIGAGSTVNIAGTFTGTGNNQILATGGGKVQTNGVTLLGAINTAPSTALIFNGGSNAINGATINGNLDFASIVNANADLNGTVTDNGNINLGTNSFRLLNSGTSLNIGSAGSLTGFGTVYQYQNNTVNNGGAINANAFGQTLNINTTSFTNTGTTEVQNGAFLSVTSANTDSGNVLVNTGGTATFSQGLTQTAGTTQVDGTLNSALTLTSGILKGSGTVVGNVVNNGGTVAPGDSPGKLAITGAFTQNGGTFSIEFNNTAHDVLAVSGLATTGGLLDVNYIGTGASTGVGSIFDILDYGFVATSLTGSQFFSNQGAGGLITGHDGFTYMLINDTTLKQLQLKELTAGNPVPETSSVVSLGLLLALGLGALTINSRRRKAVR